MTDDNSNLISPEHVSAVGYLVLAISVMENRIMELLASVLKLNVVDAMVAFHHQQSTVQIDILASLLDSHLRKADKNASRQYGPIFAVLQRAKNLTEYRNMIVHESYIEEEEGHPRVIRFSTRSEIRKGRKVHDIEEILRRAREAEVNAQSLASLATDLRK